jgi:tetratricopeptide (TPR) repeat protein
LILKSTIRIKSGAIFSFSKLQLTKTIGPNINEQTKMSSDHSSTTTASQSNANNPQNGAGRPLPKKEADIFKNLVKQYEMKQYKKAMKHADMILRKFPNHGETLAMKGLIVNNYNTNNINTNNNNNKSTRNEEAHALVKLGLKNDMRYVCECVLRKAKQKIRYICISLHLT